MAQSQALTRLVAKTKKSNIRWHRYEGYLFIAPLIIGIVAFIFLPIAASLYMSFHTWDMVSPPELVGLKNYARLVSRDRLFWKVLGNTFRYAGWIIVPSVAFPLILAALLDRPIRLRYLYRLAFFLPLVTSVVAVGLMFRWLYDGEFGLINYSLSWVGIDGPNWLSDPFWAMPAVAMVTVWQGLGYNMVLYLAGLQGIPDHLYEAATIDGAGPLSRFFKITIPLRPSSWHCNARHRLRRAPVERLSVCCGAGWIACAYRDISQPRTFAAVAVPASMTSPSRPLGTWGNV